VQSNHIRQVAAVAAKLGLKARLVQESWVDWPDAVNDRVGNIMLSRIMGAEVELVEAGFGIGVKDSWNQALEDNDVRAHREVADGEQVDVLHGQLHGVSGDTWMPQVLLLAPAPSELTASEAADVAVIESLLDTVGERSSRSAVAVMLLPGRERLVSSTGLRLHVDASGTVRTLLIEATQRIRVTDVDGSRLWFTPHDMRRIFASDVVNSGLPIYIAQQLLGHLDLNTTQGYVAVYPTEIIRHYRNFIDRRRGTRPSEEYREPTAEEWTEFQEHFSLRRVALGSCHRPYGTPCVHEHAPLTELAPACRAVGNRSRMVVASLSA
jgi:hypothetical protein